ncbi:MAG: hypothetical protein QW350_05430 [Candidatus Aenigmatarchaeota archaeon]
MSNEFEYIIGIAEGIAKGEEYPKNLVQTTILSLLELDINDLYNIVKSLEQNTLKLVMLGIL